MVSDTRKTCCVLMALSIVVSTQASGQEESIGELAKEAQNPIADLISLPFQSNTNFGTGSGNDTQEILNVQPVWPVEISDGWTMITRTIIPVISQPGLGNQDRTNGLGDTVFTAFFSPKDSGSVTWGVGPAALLPTATDDVLGQEKWGLGPSFVVLAMPGKWVVGSLFSQLWSVAGSGKQDVSFFTWQYFVNYNITNGWYLTTAPINTANWKASSASGNRWTIPVGGGGGKVFKVGKRPINASMQGYHNVEKTDFGADWQLRIQFQLLFPK
jgi:hypothetical protein